jgi:ketosteroid isomerase-like protein
LRKPQCLPGITCTWIGLAACCLAQCLAHAQDRGEIESKVLALERSWGAAAQMRDTKALESIFDNSMVYVDIDGRLMTKAQVLADTMAVSPVDIVVQSSVARSQGNAVIVTGVLQLKGVEGGKPYLRYGRFLDTWLDKGDHWVCVSSMTTEITKSNKD